MKPAMLTEHFSFNELTACPRHPELQDKNRLEAAAFEDKLREVCGLLEPLRAQFGPITVTSGYRCPALNTAVGGVPDSQHAKAEAADIVPQRADLDEVFTWARENLPQFGQLIREPGWIHISLGQPYRPADKCREVLIFDGKTYRRV